MKVLLTIGYDGSGYCGWQRQANQITVQQVIEEGLAALYSVKVSILGASRTDSGVHARCQKAVFSLPNENIPSERVALALNAKLPPDIRIYRSEAVADDFHVINDVERKTYRYQIQTGEVYDPLLTRYAYHVKGNLDVSAMKLAANGFIGRHDFKAFCAAHSGAATTIREIYSLHLFEKEGLICFDICGNGFLYNMIRIIAGTLIDVGKGRISPDGIKAIIGAGKREMAGKTAGAQGLILMDIEYKTEQE